MYPPARPVNAATDGQKMRSVIAEDPDWSLALVPFLTTLCLQHIINHFEGKQYKCSAFIHITTITISFIFTFTKKVQNFDF